MKNTWLALPVLALTVLASGCNPPAEDAQATTTEQFAKVKSETKEAARDMKDYAYTQKAQFVSQMQGQLADINRDIDQLSAKVEKANDTVKAEAKPKLQALREQTAKLNKQLEEVANATESTWDSVKDGSRKGYEALKDGFQQARQWASDKIAP